MTKAAPANQDKPQSWQGVVEVIHKSAPYPLNDRDANDAARNLVAFCRLALEIRKEIEHDAKHVRP